MNMREKRAKKRPTGDISTRQFIGAKEVTDYSLVTYEHGELVYFDCEANPISQCFQKPVSVPGSMP